RRPRGGGGGRDPGSVAAPYTRVGAQLLERGEERHEEGGKGVGRAWEARAATGKVPRMALPSTPHSPGRLVAIQALKPKRWAARRRRSARDSEPDVAGLRAGCLADGLRAVAEGGAARGSGRVGRGGDGRAGPVEPLAAAVVTGERHVEPLYVQVLTRGVSRYE